MTNTQLGYSSTIGMAGRASLIALAGALGLSAGPVWAQDETTQAEAAEPAAPTTGAGDAAAAGEETIVITGSRIARSGFTTPTPVTVVGEERLDALAITNIADGLNQLPSFRATASPANQQTLGGNIGARTLDLRGLGASRTLVLVDGRRFVPSTAEGTVDVNLIPSALIQRAEVVTGGASAVYGSDAVAGVVNFILDRKFEGLKFEAQAGVSERGDDENQFVSLVVGRRVGDRAHIVGAFEYENNEGLGGCYEARSWCAQERQIVGNTPPGSFGLPSSIITNDSHTSTLYPGGVINRSLDANGVPIYANLLDDPLRGIKFLPDGTPGQFQYGEFAGPLFMIGGDGHGTNAFLTSVLLKVPVERYSGYVSGTVDLSDSITAFADISYGKVMGTTFSSTFRDFNGSLMGAIRRDNAFLPDQVAAIMDTNGIDQFILGRAALDFGRPRGDSKTSTFRAVTGLEGELGGNWRWNVYYQYGQTRFRQDISNVPILANVRRATDAVQAPNGEIVCRVNVDGDATNDDPSCAPLNFFGENRYSAAALDYVLGEGFQKTRTSQHVVAGSISGDLVELWAGPLSVAAGAEWRRNEIEGETDPISAVNGFWVLNGQAVSGSQSVKEAYAEATLPLARDVPFARLLELNGAIRYTDYSTSGSVVTWKAGAIWEPARELRFRVTRSRDIRAPNLSELRGPQTRTTIGLTDPRTGLQTNPTVIRGSNANLVEEKADSWTAGVVFSPSWGFLSRARLSVDYYNIKVEDAIGVIGAQTLVQRCEAGATEFCPLITRDPGGTILSVQDVLLNANALKTTGFDIELDYTQPLGRHGDLSFRFLANIVKDLITTDSAGSVDRAGQTGSRAGALLGVPDYTLNGLLTWNHEGSSISLQGRYIPSGIFNVAFIGPDDPDYAVTLPNSVNNNKIPDRFYLDLAGQYVIRTASGTEFELFGAINNLLDRDPPAMPSGNLGTNQVLFDPVGRAFRVGVRVRM